MDDAPDKSLVVRPTIPCSSRWTREAFIRTLYKLDKHRVPALPGPVQATGGREPAVLGFSTLLENPDPPGPEQYKNVAFQDKINMFFSNQV